MPRSVNHVASKARRKKILKLAKGYYGRRKNVLTVAKNAVDKALGYAYIGRKQKKRHFRSLWIVRINAGARQQGLSYSQLMDKIHKSGIELNRKVLADLAMNHPAAFEAVVQQAISNANNGVVKTAVATKIVSKSVSTSKTEGAKSESVSRKLEAESSVVSSSTVTTSTTSVESEESAVVVKSATKADDLKIVEGIGPKIEQLFHEGGIKTFAELAETSLERMQEILDAAGSRFRTHNPGTWAQQGALARDGKWDELKALQESLNGGV